MKIETNQETSLEIESIESLKKVLKKHNVNWNEWATSNVIGHKSLDYLFNEIKEKDCTFFERNGELIRRLNILGLKIYFIDGNQKYVLVEDRQEYETGETRKREKWSSVSEKIKVTEMVNGQTIARALQEELQIDGGYSFDFLGSEVNQRKTNANFSGIVSEYSIHKYNVFLDKNKFKPDGYKEIRDGITTYFVWEKLI